MTWLAEILKALAAAVADAFSAWLQRRDADAALKQAGAAEAAAETSQTIAEIADAQAHNNAVDRGGAAGVAGRLRGGASRPSD